MTGEPFDKPPSRFTELSPEQRRFIRGLGDDDLKTLKHMIGVFGTVRGWCRVNRWLFVAALGLLIMVWQGIDALKHLLTPTGKY